MPPVVSAEEVELGDRGDERRRRWREQKQVELDCRDHRQSKDSSAVGQHTVTGYTCVHISYISHLHQFPCSSLYSIHSLCK